MVTEVATKTMRRWSLGAFGRDNLRLEEVAVPQPSAGEVLIRVEAASLNYRDLSVIENGSGWPLPFPFTPGSDMAGRIVASGATTGRFAVGDRVMAAFSPRWIEGPARGSASKPFYEPLGGEFQGVLADYVVMPEDWLVRAPASLDAGEAATLPCAGVTAWSALVETGKLKAGETVLVHGTGGVALFGLAIARAMGASVYVVTSSDDKAARVKALGAAGVLRRDSGDWVPEFYRLTGDHGADHVVETVGGANLGRSVSAAAPGGRVALIGVIDGFEVTAPTGPLMLKWVTVQGIGVGPRSSLEALAAAVESVGIKPVIDRRYRLEELPAALDHLARGPFGKLVIEL